MNLETEFTIRCVKATYSEMTGELMEAVVFVNDHPIPRYKMGSGYEYEHGWGYYGTCSGHTAAQVCRHIFPNQEVAAALLAPFETQVWQYIGPNQESFERKLDLTDFLIDNRHILKQFN